MTKEEHLVNIHKVLVFVSDEIKRQNINWLLGGSGALYIWGVKVIPNDLDILVPPAELPKLETIWGEYLTTKEDSKFKMMIQGTQVEIHGIDTAGEEKVFLDFKGRKIPVNPLQRELGFYENRPNKQDKVALIKQRLQELQE